jgi:hypothetical protein
VQAVASSFCFSHPPKVNLNIEQLRGGGVGGGRASKEAEKGVKGE